MLLNYYLSKNPDRYLIFNTLRQALEYESQRISNRLLGIATTEEIYDLAFYSLSTDDTIMFLTLLDTGKLTKDHLNRLLALSASLKKLNIFWRLYINIWNLDNILLTGVADGNLDVIRILLDETDMDENKGLMKEAYDLAMKLDRTDIINHIKNFLR